MVECVKKFLYLRLKKKNRVMRANSFFYGYYFSFFFIKE